MLKSLLDRCGTLIYAAMRIALAFLYLCHGLQKVFGVLGAHRSPIGSLLWTAGLIEVAAGLLILTGLFTTWAAFIASGEMAAAYFHAHAPRGTWPVQNRGELAVALCFAFLYIAARGGGPVSLDRLRGRR